MPTFASLKPAERDWIAANLDGAGVLVATFASEHADRPISLEALDRAWDAWLATAPSDSDEINRVINCIGCQFGQFLVEQAEFDWTIATDDFGTDLAVRALPGRADFLVFPNNFVAKRWERRETGFLAASYRVIVEQVREIASQWGQSKKPWWRFWSPG